MSSNFDQILEFLPNPFFEKILLNEKFIQLNFSKITHFLDTFDIFISHKEFFFDKTIHKKIAYNILNFDNETPVFFEIKNNKLIIKNFLQYCSYLYLSKPIKLQCLNNELSYHFQYDSFSFQTEDCFNYFIPNNAIYSFSHDDLFTWDNPQETKKNTIETVTESFKFLQNKQKHSFTLNFLELWFNDIEPSYKSKPSFLVDLISLFENVNFEHNVLNTFFHEKQLLNPINAKFIVENNCLDTLKILLTLDINVFHKRTFFDLCSPLLHNKDNILELLDYSLLISRYDRSKIIPIFFNSSLPLFLQINKEIIHKLKDRLLDKATYLAENIDYILLNCFSTEAKKVIINDKSLFFSLFLPTESMIQYLITYKTKNCWINKEDNILELFGFAQEKYKEQLLSNMFPLLEHLPKNVVSNFNFLIKLLKINPSYYLYLKKIWPKYFKKIPEDLKKKYFLEFFQQNRYSCEDVILDEILKWVSITDIKSLLKNSIYASLIFEQIKKHPKYCNDLDNLLFLFNDCSNNQIEPFLINMIHENVTNKNIALKYQSFHLVYENIPYSLKEDFDISFAYISHSEIKLNKIPSKLFYNKEFCLNIVGKKIELPEFIPQPFWYDKNFTSSFFHNLYQNKKIISSLTYFPFFIKNFFNPLERQMVQLSDDDYFRFLNSHIHYLDLTKSINKPSNNLSQTNIKHKIKKI